MKIVAFLNLSYSHVIGGLSYLNSLQNKYEIHIYVEEKYAYIFCNKNYILHFYDQRNIELSRRISLDYAQYTGGLETRRTNTTLNGMEAEMSAMLEYIIRASLVYFRSIVDEVRALKPDLILRDSCSLFGRFIADELGVPVYGFVTSPVLTEEEIKRNKRLYLSLINNYDLSNYSDAEVDSFYNQIRASFSSICKKYNVRTVATDYLINPDEQRNFCYSLPFDEDVSHDRYYYFRPAIFENKYKTTEKENIAYVSSGSVANYTVTIYNALINALKNRYSETTFSFRYINSGVVRLKNLPENIKFVEFADQKEILRRASLFVTHAGYNSLLEAIFYRTPMIAIPLANDEYLNSYFISKNNLGIVVDKMSIYSSRDLVDAFNSIKTVNGFERVLDKFNKLPKISELDKLI